MSIVFFETMNDDQAVLEQLLAGHDLGLRFTDQKLTSENVSQYADAEMISVFVNSMVTPAIIDALPQLKLITTRSTGFDHIDCQYAKSKDIAVATVPAYGTRTVAEFAFALLLALSRKIYPAHHNLKEGCDFRIAELQGFDLYGKTLGVVGTGKIGKNVVRIAKGFGMQIIAYDVQPDTAFASEQGFTYVDLPALLASADIVTLHAPYTESTHHLINASNIGLMKKGALLINTARGELVETGALVTALASGHLAGAGLDVLEGERQLKEELHLLANYQEQSDFKMLMEDHVLIDMPNVIVTPHIAFDTREAVREILQTTADNVIGFLSGKPQNIIA